MRTHLEVALELNLSCPHMDRPGMGSNIGKDQELISVVTQAVQEWPESPRGPSLPPRRPTHEGHRPRPLQEKASRNSYLKTFAASSALQRLGSLKVTREMIIFVLLARPLAVHP